MEAPVNKRIEPYYERISLKEFIQKSEDWFRYILSKWIIVLFFFIVGGVAGLGYALNKKAEFIAECTFVLEESGPGANLGQYAGIASMVGINLGGAAGGIFQGDNIIELYKSRRMIKNTLMSFASFNGKRDLLINRYISINNLREKWQTNPKLRNISFNIPESQFTLQHDSIISSIVKELNRSYIKVEKPDKKLSIISVRVSYKDEPFAKNFANQLVATVNDFYIETHTKKANENLAILQKQADSVRSVLNLSIGAAASSIDANPNANPAMQILRVPLQRKQVDIQANSAIYAEIVKNLEIARLSVRQETPLIQVIDKPIFPLVKVEVSKLICFVAGGFLGGVVCLLFLVINRIYCLARGENIASHRSAVL
ncbi:lipopolysaccharide biosynthesis protein [Arcticibacter tournemirensis]